MILCLLSKISKRIALIRLFCCMCSISMGFLPALQAARPALGVSVYYQHLGNLRYRLMANVHRECNGLPYASTVNAGLRSGSCYTAITLTRDSIFEQRINCNNATVCQPPNGSSGTSGIEIQRFSLVVDFSQTPYSAFTQSACCDVVFSFEDMMRTGLNSMQDQDIFAPCTLNLCQTKGLKKGNSSAIPYFHIPRLVWLKQTNQISFHALDPDGDSLVYTLAKPRQSASLFATYKSGYSETNPLSVYCPGTPPCTPSPNSNPPRGFFLDGTTGDMVFQPTLNNEQALICVEITEFRRDSSGVMRKIGSSVHERGVLCLGAGSNLSPTITVPAGVDACAGEKQCYTFLVTDKKISSAAAPDTLRLKWFSSLSGASVSTTQTIPNEATVKVCYNTKSSDTLPNAHFFTLWADDNFCPTPARAQQTLRFRVMNKPDFKLSVSKLPGSRMVYQLNTGKKTAAYSVALRGPDNYFRNIRYTSPQVLDTIQFPDAGLYTVEASISVPGFCSFILRDSIKMEGCIRLKQLSKPSNPVCATLPLTLSVEPSNAVGSIQYRWSDGQNATLSTSDSLKFLPVRDTFIRLWVRDQVACEATVEWNISSYRPSLTFQSPATVFCSEGTSAEWPVITAVQPASAQFSAALKGLVEARNNSYFTGARIPLKGGVKQDARVIISYTDSAGCPVQDSILVTVNPSPHSKIQNDTFCGGSDAYPLFNLIQNQNLLKYNYQARCFAGPTSNVDALVSGGNQGRFLVAGRYDLEFKTSDLTTGCAGLDSFHVQLFRAPVYNLLTPDSPCALSPVLTLNKFVQVNTVTPVISWKAVAFDGNTKDPLLGNIISNGDHFFPAKAGNWLLAFRESSTYCPLNDTIKLNVRPLPQPTLGADTAINLDELLNLTPGVFSAYRWDDGQVGASRMVKAQNLGIGSHLIWVRVSDLYSCSASDSLYLQVRPIGTRSKAYGSEPYRYYPNPFNTRIYLNLPEEVNEVSLYTVNGQKVEVPVEMVKGVRVLHTDSLPAGFYVLAIEYKTEVRYFRMTKQTP